MDNKTALPEMSDEESTALLKRLRAHSETQAQKAFQAGDRERYEFWSYRDSQLNGIIVAEAMKADLQKLKQKMDGRA